MKITDAFYATIGAPVIAGRKISEYGGKAATALMEGVEASAAEGREVAEKYGDGNVVEELNTRFEVDERVGKLRDQVEGVVERWREGFLADKKEESKKTTAKKPAAKKTAAKKPAAKKTTAKKTSTAKKDAEKVAEDVAEKVEVTS